MRLKDKVAIITGGAQGIGRCIALTFAEQGSDVAIADINLDKAVQVAEEIESLGRRSLAIYTDVSKSADVDNMVKKTKQKLSHIDILVNSAGIYETAKLMDTTEELWGKVIDINLKGTFLCCQAVASFMMARRYGKIINISSISGRTKSTLAGLSYCVSKAGVVGLTIALAAQLAEYNINVNAIAPAMVETDMISFLNAEQKAKLIETIPLKRAGQPRDIAETALFLASEGADFITGETINVNGGSFMD